MEFEVSKKINPEELKPRTLAELIVMYADEINKDGTETSMEKRHAALKVKHVDDAVEMRTIEAAQQRVRLCSGLIEATEDNFVSKV
jgi:hypothetical protein